MLIMFLDDSKEEVWIKSEVLQRITFSERYKRITFKVNDGSYLAYFPSEVKFTSAYFCLFNAVVDRHESVNLVQFQCDEEASS